METSLTALTLKLKSVKDEINFNVELYNSTTPTPTGPINRATILVRIIETNIEKTWTLPKSDVTFRLFFISDEYVFFIDSMDHAKKQYSFNSVAILSKSLLLTVLDFHMPIFFFDISGSNIVFSRHSISLLSIPK